MATYRRRPQWAVDLSGVAGRDAATLAEPPGFSRRGADKESQVNVRVVQEASDVLKLKKAWEVAVSPGKSLPMNAFMMYMAGSTVHIFSIMITFMMFFNPIKAILGVNQAFAKFEGLPLAPQKLVFVLCNCAGIAMALYKCSTLGLLPTAASDWLAFRDFAKINEVSGGGVVF